MTRKQLETVYAFAKRIFFLRLISFILRAWAKLNPNSNVNYLVMDIGYPKHGFWVLEAPWV